MDEERAGPDEHLLEKVAVAKPLTEEELEELDARRRQRRKQRVAPGDRPETVDWETTSEKSQKEKTVSMNVVGGVAMLTVLIGALGVFYIQKASEGEKDLSRRVVGDAASNEALSRALQIPVTTGAEDTAILQSIEAYNDFDLIKIEEAIRSFLESDTVDERVKWVRDPERVKPLMENYYHGQAIVPEGFESLNKTEVSYRGRFLTTMVRAGDYLGYPIAVIRIGDGDDSRYLVDWESWAGYGDLSPEQARESKPTEPFLMRVILRPENYYNFDFSDDRKWNAFSMSFRISDETFLAYTAKGSEADEALHQLRQESGSAPYTVEVRYPENSRMDDQVEIVKVVGSGWIDVDQGSE